MNKTKTKTKTKPRLKTKKKSKSDTLSTLTHIVDILLDLSMVILRSLFFIILVHGGYFLHKNRQHNTFKKYKIPIIILFSIVGFFYILLIILFFLK